ncbi:MAG: prolipoprotein diacylglyceryl transferase [Firmicutes bacterium]|nr:prolipoprotein diacylglyceryl transferase [Bacillota bacterium]
MLPELNLNLGHFFLVVPMYNLLIGLGMVCAFLLWTRLTAKSFRPPGHHDRLTFVMGAAIIFGFAGAAVFDSLVHARPLSFGGLTFYGGLLAGGLSFCFLYLLLLSRQYLLEDIELIAPCLVIAHGFGRIGCFLAGCCYGSPVAWGGVLFPAGSPPFLHHGGPVLPTQLFEAGFLFLLVGWLLRRPGANAARYLFAYGLFRFLMEFFRGDVRGAGIGVFSPSQVMALAMIALAVVLLRLSPAGENEYQGPG